MIIIKKQSVQTVRQFKSDCCENVRAALQVLSRNQLRLLTTLKDMRKGADTVRGSVDGLWKF